MADSSGKVVPPPDLGLKISVYHHGIPLAIESELSLEKPHGVKNSNLRPSEVALPLTNWGKTLILEKLPSGP